MRPLRRAAWRPFCASSVFFFGFFFLQRKTKTRRGRSRVRRPRLPSGAGEGQLEGTPPLGAQGQLEGTQGAPPPARVAARAHGMARHCFCGTRETGAAWWPPARLIVRRVRGAPERARGRMFCHGRPRGGRGAAGHREGWPGSRVRRSSGRGYAGLQVEGTPASSRVGWPARGYAALQLEGG
jgi:hypothetical protein